MSEHHTGVLWECSGPEAAGCVRADDSQGVQSEEGGIGELDPSTGEFSISYIEWADLNSDLGYSFYWYALKRLKTVCPSSRIDRATSKTASHFGFLSCL